MNIRIGMSLQDLATAIEEHSAIEVCSQLYNEDGGDCTEYAERLCDELELLINGKAQFLMIFTHASYMAHREGDWPFGNENDLIFSVVYMVRACTEHVIRREVVS